MNKLRRLAFGSSLLLVVVMGACGGTGDDDGGTTDAANDATSQSDSLGGDASQEASLEDGPADANQSETSSGDGGGLNQGDTCDPQNDQCKPGLKCCQGGVIILDAASDYKCLQEGDSGKCPLVP